MLSSNLHLNFIQRQWSVLERAGKDISERLHSALSPGLYDFGKGLTSPGSPFFSYIYKY